MSFPFGTHYTGDQHLDHDLMREMRGFKTIKEMNETIIENFNSVVRKNDRTFHLGDFTYRGDPRRAAALFNRMNGSHFLVIGNHDDKDTLALRWAGQPSHLLQIKDGDVRVVLLHYAMRTWPGIHRGAIQLYGHSHNRIPADDRSCDVGVDAWGLFPTTMEQIKARLALAPSHKDPETQEFNADNPGGLTL